MSPSERIEDHPGWQNLQASVTELARSANVRLHVELIPRTKPTKRGQSRYRLYGKERKQLVQGVPNHIKGFVEGLVWRHFNPDLDLRLKRLGSHLTMVIDSKATPVCAGTLQKTSGFLRGAEKPQPSYDAQNRTAVHTTV
jgi:hypothetical protein